jgi:Zn-dependent protease
MFFLLFATFTMYLAWTTATSTQDNHGDELMFLAALLACTLLVSVLLHELGHLFAVRHYGGYADTIVLGPLGGLQPIRVPNNAVGQFWAVLAGPLTSLVICLSCFLLVSLEEQSLTFGLLQPLPNNLINVSDTGSWFGSTVLRLACWANWWLVVVNLIPAFPFDGGQACLALIRLLKPNIPQESAVAIVAVIARIVAIGLLVMALLVNNAFATSAVPSWLPLVMLAIFVFFSARKEESQVEQPEHEDIIFGYDFSQGYTSLEQEQRGQPEQPTSSPVVRWIDGMREKREEQRRAVEEAEDKQVDSILKRLHQHGMENLSPEERSLLKRVSARYRSRESK